MNQSQELPIKLQVVATLLIVPGLLGIVSELLSIIIALFQPFFVSHPDETPLSTLYFVLFVSTPLRAIPVALGIGLLWRSEMFRWLSILYMAAWSVWKLPTVLIMYSVYLDGNSNESPFALFVLGPVYVVLSLAYVWAIYTLSRPYVRAVFARGDKNECCTIIEEER